MARCKFSARGLLVLACTAVVISGDQLSTCFLSILLFFSACKKLNETMVLIAAAANFESFPSCYASTPPDIKSKSSDSHTVPTTKTEDDAIMAKKDGEVTMTEDAVHVTCPVETVQVTGPEDVSLTSTEGIPPFDLFPFEIQGLILEHFSYEHLFQLKLVSNKLKALVESNGFQALSLREKPRLTASFFFIENGDWQWAGFDLSLRKWRRMPSLDLKFLPANCKPDPDSYKEFLVCAKDGLLCINFSKSAHKERLIVINPLSRKFRELPPLNHRRNPVLMHMLVDPITQSYQVFAAGSSKSGDEDLSRITEVYDSRTEKWRRMGDLPGPAFALNEYQSGVFQEGRIFCIGFVEDNDQVTKGILGYDVEEGKWLSKWTHPFSFCTFSATILQLVENNGEVYLFSERENGRSTQHLVDRLEWIRGNGDEKNICTPFNVIQKQKIGGRSLEVYPEHVCVPHSEGQLCILNAIDHTGVVYNIRDQEQSEFLLEAPPKNGFRGELGFFSLNPITFTLEPRSNINV